MQRATNFRLMTSSKDPWKLKSNSSRFFSSLMLLKKLFISELVYWRAVEDNERSRQEMARFANFGKSLRDLVIDMRRELSTHEQSSNWRVMEESSLHSLSRSMKVFTELLFANFLRVIWRVVRDLVVRRKSKRWPSWFSLGPSKEIKARSSLARCAEFGIFFEDLKKTMTLLFWANNQFDKVLKLWMWLNLNTSWNSSSSYSSSK